MRLLFVVAAAAVASGCASNYGTQTVNDFNRFMQLEEGETTKSQVYDLFGQPHGIAHVEESGETIWTYVNSRVTTNATTYVPFSDW